MCTRYPRKLLRYLKEVEHFTIREIERGICYVEGDRFPIQIIIIPRLSKQENLWLKNLTNHLEHVSDAKDLITEYMKYKDNVLYQSVMDVVVSANIEKFREVKKMCNALMELMKDEFDETEKKGISQGMTKGQSLQMITLIQRKLKKGKSLETAAYELEEDTDAIKDIYEMVKAHPAAGNEDIYQFLHPVT